MMNKIDDKDIRNITALASSWQPRYHWFSAFKSPTCCEWRNSGFDADYAIYSHCRSPVLAVHDICHS